jgi:hypothetical protein
MKRLLILSACVRSVFILSGSAALLSIAFVISVAGILAYQAKDGPQCMFIIPNFPQPDDLK